MEKVLTRSGPGPAGGADGVTAARLKSVSNPARPASTKRDRDIASPSEWRMGMIAAIVVERGLNGQAASLTPSPGPLAGESHGSRGRSAPCTESAALRHAPATATAPPGQCAASASGDQ